AHRWCRQPGRGFRSAYGERTRVGSLVGVGAPGHREIMKNDVGALSRSLATKPLRFCSPSFDLLRAIWVTHEAAQAGDSHVEQFWNDRSRRKADLRPNLHVAESQQQIIGRNTTTSSH